MMHELEAAWRELDADPDVRVIVNTGAGDAFQTGVDVAQMSRDRDALREQSRRTKRFELRLHRVAQRRDEAGDRGRQRRVRGRRAALRRRRRRRDRGERRRRSSIRTCRSGQASVYETIALAKKSPMEAGAAHGVHRAGTSGCRPRRAYQLGIVSEVVDPPERLRGGRAGARRADRAAARRTSWPR